MHFVKSKAILAMLGLFLMVGIFATGGSSALAATTGPGAAHTALNLRPETSSETVCLLNVPTECADVKGNSNTAGTDVWLQHNGADDKWVLTPDTSCVAGLCYYIKDAANTALCMAATGTGGAHVVLEKCNETGSWYDEGSGSHEVGNADHGESGTLITNGDAANDYLFTNTTGTYMRWSIPGLN